MKKNKIVDFLWKVICIVAFAVLIVELEDASFITWVLAIAITFFILRWIYRKWFFEKIYGVQWNEELAKR